MILLVAGFLIVLLWFYVLFAREWMIAKWPDRFARWHKIEDYLWDRSRTILAARVYWFGGLVVGAQQLISDAGVDTTPLTSALAEYIPSQYRGLAIGVGMVLTGILFEWLRKQTTQPLGQHGS